MSKLKSGETKWSEAKFVSRTRKRSAQNPVLMRNNNPNDHDDPNHGRIVHSRGQTRMKDKGPQI